METLELMEMILFYTLVGTLGLCLLAGIWGYYMGYESPQAPFPTSDEELGEDEVELNITDGAHMDHPKRQTWGSALHSDFKKPHQHHQHHHHHYLSKAQEQPREPPQSRFVEEDDAMEEEAKVDTEDEAKEGTEENTRKEESAAPSSRERQLSELLEVDKLEMMASVRHLSTELGEEMPPDTTSSPSSMGIPRLGLELLSIPSMQDVLSAPQIDSSMFVSQMSSLWQIPATEKDKVIGTSI